MCIYMYVVRIYIKYVYVVHIVHIYKVRIYGAYVYYIKYMMYVSKTPPLKFFQTTQPTRD